MNTVPSGKHLGTRDGGTFEEYLDRYAKLAIHTGCNLQPGQELFVSADLSQAELVRRIVREAYESGSGEVTVRWSDETCGRMRYDYRPLESFGTFPDWLALLLNGEANRGAAILSITSEDPESMTGVDQHKMVAWAKAAHEACKDWRDGMDFGARLCIIGGASPAWASRVFPDLPVEEATSRLWEAIFETVRVDTEDPLAAWQKHKESFAERKAWLNDHRFDHLHYTNSIGTDLTIGLTEHSLWAGGGAETTGGTYFFPNIPTEECFTSPDRNRCEGTVVASMPLNHNGSLVKDFSLTFHEGRVVDFQAETGYDVLKEIIDTDEGSHRLGECALIPSTSPIRKTGILFLNTLFDENASCHIALGMAFPECFEGGLDMSKDELLEHGINDSITHVDFMLGTDDLHIDGIDRDGVSTPIFDKGVWAF